jgi:hypothetical protein
VYEVVKDNDSMGMGFMTYKGLWYLIHGCLCRGCVAPSFANTIFPVPSFLHSLFLSSFKDMLKAIVLAWCPYNDNSTHKYLAEMRRMAHDETPFLLVVQLRATTLAWWLDDGNVIPLDTHDNDSLTHDETSYPPTNPLTILSFILVGPPFLTNKHFIVFLGDPWAKHLEVLYIGFIFFPTTIPLVLQPLLSIE